MKKVLIVGNSYSLAKKLSSLVDEVFVIPGNNAVSNFATIVDIRENSTFEILDFVLENDIDLTIVTSQKALKSDLVSVFVANEKPVFAPSQEVANYTVSLSAAKKLLYKLKVPTPKFAVFEKLPLALDYLQSANYPLVISNDDNSVRQCCTTVSIAKTFVEELFQYGENKVVFQDFAYGHEFTLYAISDGYHALPLTTVANFKFTENGDGGRLTNGIGAYVPDNKISNDIILNIYQNVILKALDNFEKNGIPYVGILGVDAVLTGENKYSVVGFKPFMAEFDSQAVINSIDENILELMEACANGFFADEYDDILLNDNISVSCLIRSRKEGIKLPDLTELDSDITYVTKKSEESFIGDNFVLTSCAKSLTRAKSILKDDIDHISFEGMKCRSDIYS